MGTLDIRRKVIRGIRALAPDVTVEVVRVRKHVILEIARPGITPRHLSLAGSPRDSEHAVDNTISQARKALGLFPKSKQPKERP